MTVDWFNPKEERRKKKKSTNIQSPVTNTETEIEMGNGSYQ
jgi:hypothetical protein